MNRKERASLSQINYLNNLMLECESREVEIPNEITGAIKNGLSYKEASQYINDLKFELGWATYGESGRSG